MTEASHAVFLSYASEDQAAAQRVCDALRAGGIEVWFDQSALRGGEAWDQTIRKQIKTCVLFIPVISRHTHEREEGYFRLEWKLAVDRSHLMTTNKAFLLPVVVDNTRENDENVPDRFRDIHWTRLPGGETSPAFVERVRRLVSPEPSHGATPTALPAAPGFAATPLTRARVATPWRSKQALPMVLAVVVIGAMAYFIIDRLWISKYPASPPMPPGVPASAVPTAFTPPPHSIAVLPFVNMSGDKEQEYFSDGLTEEILNSLARINELQVAARTSAFSFKGKDTDIGTIARKLNVGAILEGSVRRSGHKIRITVQLNNAVTGFHLWSQTYDRDLSDVLALQTEIANAVAGALKVTLLGDVAAKIEAGGTRNPAAFDAYLRAEKLWRVETAANLQAAIAAYSEAIRLDQTYALALAGRSWVLTDYADSYAGGPAIRESLDRARADAQRAIELAPDLAEGHWALAAFFESSLDFTRASEEYDRAVALAPGNAEILAYYGGFMALMGRGEAGIAAVRRAVTLDPLNTRSRTRLGQALYFAHRYDEAAAAFKGVLLDPDRLTPSAYLGLIAYAQGDFQGARVACEKKPDYSPNQLCLAVTYEKVGRHADAEATLAKIKAAYGDAAASLYAAIYAQWGDTAKALQSLEMAMRVHDSGLEGLKTDPLLDPLRKEPRFQAIERELKFPSN